MLGYEFHPLAEKELDEALAHQKRQPFYWLQRQ